jgi:lipopolysaccharide export system protein LptA
MKIADTLMAAVALFATLGFAAGPASAQKERSAAILPGGNPKQPINIQATKLDYFDKEQKLIYTGNVLAVNGESKLKCSVLTIYLPPKVEGQSATPASTNQVQRMEAQGPVTMLQKDQIGTGDAAVYEKAQNRVVMTGHVTLSQGPNVTQGDTLVYDLKTGQARVTGGNVRSVFIPGNSSDETPAAKPSAKRGSRSEAATQ